MDLNSKWNVILGKYVVPLRHHIIHLVYYSSVYQPFFVNTINDLCLGTVNETDKGKEVKKHGTPIGFPFTVTDSSVKSTGKFHES